MKQLAYILLSALFLFLFIQKGAVYASSLSLGVYPPLINIQTSAGSHIQKQIQVSNNSSFPTTVNIVLKMFTSSDKKNGDIIFLPQTTTIKNFFTQDIKILDGTIQVNQLLITPREKKLLTLDITLPKEIQEQDYY